MTATDEEVREWKALHSEACGHAERWRDRYFEDHGRLMELQWHFDEQEKLLAVRTLVYVAVLGMETQRANGVFVEWQPLWKALAAVQRSQDEAGTYTPAHATKVEDAGPEDS